MHGKAGTEQNGIGLQAPREMHESCAQAGPLPGLVGE